MELTDPGELKPVPYPVASLTALWQLCVLLLETDFRLAGSDSKRDAGVEPHDPHSNECLIPSTVQHP